MIYLEDDKHWFSVNIIRITDLHNTPEFEICKNNTKVKGLNILAYKDIIAKMGTLSKHDRQLTKMVTETKNPSLAQT